jgi:hypothetical protein
MNGKSVIIDKIVKGYTINMIESQFRKRGIKRVSYENGFNDFSITLIRQ